MEGAAIFKAFLEVGVLGICAITMITILLQNHKRFNKKDDEKDIRIDKKDDNQDKRYDKMMELMQQQNKEFHDQLFKQMEVLTNSIVNGVVNHTPSQEESKKVTKVSEEIDKCLQEMLLETSASRASLVQYHNGGKGINRQSFLKMSMTNEQVQLGVKPIISTFKDQFRSALSYFVKQINDTGFCYIDDYITIQDKDTSMYEFLRDRGVESKYGIAVKNIYGNIIGFICIEYSNKKDAKPDAVKQSFSQKQKIIETLLNL